MFFIKQPITSAECFLYEAERIILTCAISEGNFDSKILDPSRISIKWYYNNGTESELTVGTNETRREGGNGDPIVISSTLTISPISQHDAVTLVQGSYYCRVNIAGWNVVSNSSQRFTVLHQDEYLQQATSCSERTFVDTERACAVYSAVVENPTTTESSESPTTDYLGSTISMLRDHTPSQSTAAPPEQNDGITDIIWIYTLVAVLALLGIIFIIMTLPAILFCIYKSKARKMAENVVCT